MGAFKAMKAEGGAQRQTGRKRVGKKEDEE